MIEVPLEGGGSMLMEVELDEAEQDGMFPAARRGEVAAKAALENSYRGDRDVSEGNRRCSSSSSFSLIAAADWRRQLSCMGPAVEPLILIARSLPTVQW
jgi:hypothetical protein